jgi:hypothetical protein
VVRRLVDPAIRTTVSLCVADQRPMSQPAHAVREILGALVRELVESGRGIGMPGAAGAAPPDAQVSAEPTARASRSRRR